ncbi:hypothetical protein [Streptomyces sp. B29(2018)]|uniref:hypothetical protein n=1 Tax=Streptomyces sp. B29(2018) TaxID=2485016 RepID=UPI000FD6ABB3|nr:hypothetical protein [Streptomyces sp. B29(2018)]
MTVTTSAPLAVIVTKADGNVTRIGPIPTPDVAEAIHASLSRPTTIPEQAAATAEVARFAPEQPHLPLLDAEIETVVELIDHPEQGVEAPYPNLWDRLVAQHGLETADALFKAALTARQTCRKVPQEAADPNAARAQADARFDHALRELLTENTGPGGISPAALDATLANIRRLADAWAQERQHPGAEA